MDTVNRQVNKQTTVKPNNDKAEASYLPNSIKQKLVLSNETLNKLINLFQSGDLAACKSMALTLTSQHPKHGFAWKILGTIYQNESQNEAARDALLTAVKLMPKDADIHYNLANAYFDLEQKKLAIKHYLKSIKIKPDFLKAHYNLGSIYFSVENYALSEKHLNTVIKLDPSHYEAYLQLTKVYDAQQNYTAAIELLKSVIALQPNFFDAYLSLAIEFQNANLKNEAIVTYEQLLSLAPERIDAYNSLGLYLLKLKKYVQAERTLLKALGIDDASPEILNSLSFVYSAQKNTEEATYYLQKSMVKNPNNVLAYINYGLLLLKRGDASSASAYFLKALEIEPENVISMNNLGLAFISIASFDNAVEQFEAVLAIEPKYVPALTNISVPLKRLGRLTEAEDYLKRALSINPKSHDTNVNLASIYQGRTDIKQSVEYNLKAIEINPKLTMAYSNMLFSMCYSNDFSKSYVNEQLEKYGDIVTKNANFEYISWLPKAHSSKLKIGFVSADFILHPVTSFLSTVLENIDSNKFELYAYTNLVKQDEITQQIKPFFKEWKTIVGVEDEDAATLIHEDGLDILIDLSGHSAGNRLPVFAYKPAPVQATWLGYWASTGVNQIDYIILDETSAPKEIADQFTEQVHYIPDSRFCYSPPNESIEISALPALKNGYVTIGCYHNYAKVTDTVLALWAEVLKQSPTTVLRWQTTAFADENMINTIHSKFSNLHIDASRIELLPSTSRQDYLLSYNDIDFVLDCFPFTACTTTSDALWMGVPTLTIAGDSLVSRQGTSLMNAVGLPNWIAKDSAQYVEKALDFLSDVNSLSKCRQNLRAQLLNSTLGDAKKFTQNIEHALTAMHQAYLSKAPVVNVEQPIQQASKVAVNIVSATRYSEGEFWAKSPLAKSVKSIIDNDPMVSLNVAFDNTSALPTLFNEQINKADDDAIIIFIHDDVIINQSDLTSVVAEGLENFDVIGVVGNKRQVPKQPAWAFIDDDFNWDDFENLSGRIYAGDETKHKENYFGPSGAKCKLIDGVFIASKKKTLLDNKVLFDPKFEFHFYDMDFCRSADNAGLSIGTWDINLTHNSGGTFGSKDWHAKYTKYLEKWESPNMDVVDIEVSEVELPDQPIIIATQYEEALNHQLEGREDEAERIYLDILAIEPNNSDVNHNLGFIEFNKVSAEHALPRFEAAVLAKPESEQYWVSYIDALMESGASETGFSAIEHGLKFGLGEESAKALREEYKQKLMPETIKAPVPQFVDGAIPGAWLQAYPKSLMIEYTSRCNLRCKYCPKSNPGEDQVPGRNMDMTNQTVDAVIELIEQHTYSELLLAGTGESTFHPNWMEDFPRIIQAGKNANPESYIHLNSNFAIKFENEHWDVLSQLDGIVISIDTSDRQLTKTVRAKSDLGLIIYNIIRFQTYCESRGLKLPQITVNVTLYQEAAAGLPELMVMLSKLPIKQVSISDMYEGKAATKNNIKAIHADDTTTFEQVIANIEKAKQLAQSLGVFTLFIQPQLIERINKMQLANQVAVDVENVSVTKGRNTTKLCLQPWTRFTLAADAAIFPCCVTDMSPVGRIDTKLEQDGLNGEKIKTFRKDLLNGNVPSICVNCTNAQSCSTNELKQAVQNLSIQHAPKVVAELVPKPETFNQENKPESEALTQVINEVLQQAIEHQVAQRFDEAKVLYDEVLAINSMQPVANLALGIMQVNQNPNNVDLKYFENAINADLDNEQNWTTYIDVLILMGDFERAQNVITVGQNHGLTQQSAQALELAIEAGLQNTLSNIDDTTTDQNIAQFLKQVLIQINREIGSQPLDSSKANSITYKKEFTPFIDVSVFKKTMTGLFEKGDVNAALVVIYKSVVSLKGKNELVGHKIFTPYFDEVLENIDLDISDVVARSGKNVNLVIASELYDFGGHTPVINEILGSVENPMLVVTDLYNRFAKNDGFAAVASTMVNCPVLIMPNESFINKTIRLAQTINSVAKNVFLLSHHDDVIATTACQKNFETDYYFIHHADHNPALGNCTKHFKHVDLFESRVKMCSEDLNTNALYLPTTAKDQGLKTFNYAENTQFSTVSGGSYGKFFNDGGVLYMSAVTASLKTTGGKHYHFGDLPDAQILKIRAHLVANGVDQQNFVYVGNVPSLWKALLDIDAHIFMGSLPVMGAKSDIEAQGAGYPLVAYQDPLGPKYLNKGSHESKTVYWSTVDGLEKGLNTVMGNHQALSKAARAYYLSQCNPQQFDSAIKELSQ